MAKERPPLEEMTLRQLRKVASEYEISRYSRMRKSQLLKAIEAAKLGDLVVKHDKQEMVKTVEAKKFELGQQVSSSAVMAGVAELAQVDRMLGELPNGYGESRIVLLPRDPQWAYAYWDIAAEQKEACRQQGGTQLALRICDATEINLDFQMPHSVQEYACDEMAREWYLPIPVSDRTYIVEIGYRCTDGRWLMLARSATVHVPPVYPTDWADDYFLAIPWEQNLIGRTFFTLVPGKRSGNGTVESYDEIFNKAREAEVNRLAGSVRGSMPSEESISSFVTASGVGMLSQSGISMVTASGVGVMPVAGSAQMAAAGMVSGATVPGSAQMTTSGVGMLSQSGISMVTASGVGMMSIAGSAQMTAAGMMSGATVPGSAQMTASGMGMLSMSGMGMVTASGVGMLSQPGIGMVTASGVGMLSQSGIGMVTASGMGMLSMSGIGMVTASGVGMLSRSGIGMVTASGVGMLSRSGIGMVTASGVGMLSMSGIGMFSAAVPRRPRQFWLVADAELIVYGATEPDAKVTIGGQSIQLEADGTFRHHMSFQDGVIDYPILAVAADGVQTRSIHMRFERETLERRTNKKEEAVPEWIR